MTAAERMRRYRARKREPIPEFTPEQKIYLQFRADGRPRLMSNAEFARRILRCSLRHCYHLRAWQEWTDIEWGDDLLNGKYGRVGAAFLAEVCTYGDARTQRAVRNRIRKAGAAAGRKLWLDLCREKGWWKLLARRERRIRRQRDYRDGY
jgi:hypothetical protein